MSHSSRFLLLLTPFSFSRASLKKNLCFRVLPKFWSSCLNFKSLFYTLIWIVFSLIQGPSFASAPELLRYLKFCAFKKILHSIFKVGYVLEYFSLLFTEQMLWSATDIDVVVSLTTLQAWNAPHRQKQEENLLSADFLESWGREATFYTLSYYLLDLIYWFRSPQNISWERKKKT